jgi:predicted nucleic acid-binding protein
VLERPRQQGGTAVAGALEGGCERLYTEDPRHGQRIEALIVDNPFRG